MSLSARLQLLLAGLALLAAATSAITFDNHASAEVSSSRTIESVPQK